MNRLLRIELLRLVSRRSVRVVAVLAVLVCVGFAVKTGYDSRPLTASERATAAAQAQIGAADGDARIQLRTCEKDPTTYLGQAGTAQGCREAILPSAADFAPRGPLRLQVVMANNGLDAALLVVVLLLLLGATFAGADWKDGSITQQVLAEPRRGRVWVAKAGAVAVSALVISAVSMAMFWVPLRVLAASRDLPVPDASDLLLYVVRVLALAVVVGVTAYALAMVLRQTAAAVGLVFGLSLAAEIVLGLIPLRGNGWLSPSHNVFAWILGRTRYLDPSLVCRSADCDRIRTLTMWPAGLLLGVVAVLVAALSWAMFRRADLR